MCSASEPMAGAHTKNTASEPIAGSVEDYMLQRQWWTAGEAATEPMAGVPPKAAVIMADALPEPSHQRAMLK